MQKSFVLCIEWDKRFNHILYIGTKTCSVKLYDIHQKRIVQELTFNKLYPLITHINPLVSTGKDLRYLDVNKTKRFDFKIK